MFWTWCFAATTVLLLGAFIRAGVYWTDRNDELAQANILLGRQLEQAAQEADRERQRCDAQLRGRGEHIQKIESLLRVRDGEIADASAAHARTAEALAETEERLRFWMAKAEDLDRRYEKANADAIAAREIVADWVAQRTFGRSIFQKAPPLPAESLHRKPVPRARIQGRLAVQLADAEFAKQEAEMLRHQREQAAAGKTPSPAAPAEPAHIAD